MKTFVTLLLQVTLIAQIGVRPTTTAPTATVSTLENEIPHGTGDEVKAFRESYAKRMKSFMNASVDPCDDFYEFACGNFANAIEDMEVTRKRSNLLDILYTSLDELDKMLQKTRHPEDRYYDELQKARQLLENCAAADLWPLKPSEEYMAVVNEMGGFPAISESWNASAFDWFNMTAYLTRYGIEGLVKEAIYLKAPFPPYYELPKFGFDFDVYLENIATKESHGYVYSEKIMKDMLKVYGVEGEKADGVVEDVIEFWREALQVEKEIHDNGGCEMATIMEGIFYEAFPRWQTFFNIAWETDNFNFTDISDCPCHLFYAKLDKIVAKKPAAAANYMALKFLFTLHPQLQSKKFQRLHCMSRVKHTLPIVLSHFYMTEVYNKEAEEDIFSIISELKDSLRHLVTTADWLDEPSRAEALDKVRTLRARVGQVTDPITEVFIEQMRRLNVTDNFATNSLALAKFEVDTHHYGFLHDNIDENTMPVEVLDAVQVNAFYYVIDNSINVMAGVLHPPVYHPHMPKSVKYGALGYILGHELTHGFDNMGSNFDSNLTQRYWWTEEAGRVFEERSNCFAQHYSGYRVPDMKRKINGTISQDENIADSGGVREALAAYRRVLKNEVQGGSTDTVRQETLPGLDLTPEQTFFLSFAQVYCSKYTPRHVWVEISDDHPLDTYRVLGSLQNFEEFPQVFNCPLGSPMNPNEKCRLW